MSLKLSKNPYVIKLKLAVISRFEFTCKVIDSSLEPLDQPLKLYPSLGDAVILTSVPSSYSPPSLDTLPPSRALTESV